MLTSTYAAHQQALHPQPSLHGSTESPAYLSPVFMHLELLALTH